MTSTTATPNSLASGSGPSSLPLLRPRPSIPDKFKRTKQEEEIISSCPLQAGPLYTTLRDLALSVEWYDLRVLELEGTGWAVILGHKRREDPIRAVLPLPLHTTSFRPSSLRKIFGALSKLDISRLPEPLEPFAPGVEELTELGRARGKVKRRSGGRSTNGLMHDDDEDDEVVRLEAMNLNLGSRARNRVLSGVPDHHHPGETDALGNTPEVEEVEVEAHDDENDGGAGEGGEGDGGTTEGKVCDDIDSEMIYVSIVTADSTVVYYRLTKGIKKPADIPDE